MKNPKDVLLILAAFLLLSNCTNTGPTLIRIETPEMPLVRAALYFPFGSGTEPSGQEGATLLVSRWTDFGTIKRSSTEFNDATLNLGAAIDTTINPRFTLITVEAPSDKFAEAWKLTLEKIRSPRLNQSDLENVRNGIVSAKKSRLTSWIVTGNQLATSVIYAGTPEAHSEYGTDSSLKVLTSHELKKFHAVTFGKGPALVLVSKTLPENSMAAIRESLRNWGSTFQKAEPRTLLRKGRNLLIIERPGSSQAYLFFVKPGPTPGTNEHALASIGTQLLGSNGGNSSILFDELRAKRGLTYHASTQVSKKPNKQMIVGVTFGANETIGELASLYMKEWKKFYETKDIPETDLKEAYIAYKATRARDAGETIGEIIAASAETISISGDVKSIWADPQVTQAAFNSAMAKWLVPDDFTLLVLGDSSKVKTVLENSIGPVADTKVLPPNADWDAVSKAIVGK
ncbi:MAG: insulinase family protein [Pseudobdellovibrionaceae bacterium]|nr:insulinase family protein [Pseudobdellovibrionaceae bacterium]